MSTIDIIRGIFTLPNIIVSLATAVSCASCFYIGLRIGMARARQEDSAHDFEPGPDGRGWEEL